MVDFNCAHILNTVADTCIDETVCYTLCCGKGKRVFVIPFLHTLKMKVNKKSKLSEEQINEILEYAGFYKTTRRKKSGRSEVYEQTKLYNSKRFVSEWCSSGVPEPIWRKMTLAKSSLIPTLNLKTSEIDSIHSSLSDHGGAAIGECSLLQVDNPLQGITVNI